MIRKFSSKDLKWVILQLNILRVKLTYSLLIIQFVPRSENTNIATINIDKLKMTIQMVYFETCLKCIDLNFTDKTAAPSC